MRLRKLELITRNFPLFCIDDRVCVIIRDGKRTKKILVGNIF